VAAVSSPAADAAGLLGQAESLVPLRDRCHEGGEDLLTCFAEAGPRELQTALDAVLEQAVDTLRALEAEADDQVARLRLLAQSARSPAQTSGLLR
jgi:hypothetical protein